jgi:integrase
MSRSFVDAEAIEALIAAAAPEFRLEFTLMGHLAMRWGEALGVGVGHVKDGNRRRSGGRARCRAA